MRLIDLGRGPKSFTSRIKRGQRTLLTIFNPGTQCTWSPSRMKSSPPPRVKGRPVASDYDLAGKFPRTLATWDPMAPSSCRDEHVQRCSPRLLRLGERDVCVASRDDAAPVGRLKRGCFFKMHHIDEAKRHAVHAVSKPLDIYKKVKKIRKN
jgi:hypothetical protein